MKQEVTHAKKHKTQKYNRKIANAENTTQKLLSRKNKPQKLHMWNNIRQKTTRKNI